jgi:hypothetical protein
MAYRTLDQWIDLARREPDECWPWFGSLNHGYGRIRIKNVEHRAHVIVYEYLIGPVPEGLWLDHECHTRDKGCPGGSSCQHRKCVNPKHLAPVTPRENWARGRSPSAENARKTECPKGHPYGTVSQTERDGPVRRCLICAYESNRRGLARKKSR